MLEACSSHFRLSVGVLGSFLVIHVLGPAPGNSESLVLSGTLRFRSSPGGCDDWSGLGTKKLGHVLRGSDHASSAVREAVQCTSVPLL